MRNFIFVLLCCLQPACSLPESPSAELASAPGAARKPDAPDWAILPADCANQVSWLGLPGEHEGFELRSADVRRVQALLRPAFERGLEAPGVLDPRALADPGVGAWIRGELARILGELPNYRKQYLGLVGSDGQRQVLVRGFPGLALERADDYPKWRSDIVVVFDGGYWFWYAIFDLDTGELLRFDCKGYA